MSKNQKISQMSDGTEFTNEERDEELLEAREEIVLLRELVESQKLHISHIEKELLETSKELEIVNDQLAKALMLGVSFDEAKAIAQTLLKGEQGGSELVAKLLNIIYGLSVETKELQVQGRFNIQPSQVNNQLANKVITQSRKARNHSQQLRLQYKELGYRFIKFRATLYKISEHLSVSNKSDG